MIDNSSCRQYDLSTGCMIDFLNIKISERLTDQKSERLNTPSILG